MRDEHNKKVKLEDIRDDIQLVKDDLEEEVKRVILFVSIDMVNSTAYKEEDSNWANVFSDFYKIVENNFTKEFRLNNSNINVWKYIGDEVLLYEEINDKSDILKAPSLVFRVMQNCQEELYKTYPNTKNRIYLKGGLWIAAIRNQDRRDSESSIKNVMQDSLSEAFREFIGVDVDEGFRISKYSSQSKLVVDMKTAYIILKNREQVNKLCDYSVEDRLKIVGYRKLKGILKNRLYPIIWYNKNWSSKEDMYLYDEHESSDIVKEIKEKKFEVESINYLDKIVREINEIEDKVKTIEGIIENKTEKLVVTTQKKLTEMHCVAVCIDPHAKKILIAKRAEEREVSKGKWEFGCAKVDRRLTIEEIIKEEYKEDFGVDIKLVMDEERKEDKQPVPLAVYNIPKDNFTFKGVIFLGIIENASNVRKRDDKHEETRWISRDDIEGFNEDAIPDFKDTLNKAFDLFEEYNQSIDESYIE